MWHRLATRLGKTVAELKPLTPATEFVKWIEFEEEEWNTRQPLHYYLAEITQRLDLLIHIQTNDPQHPQAFTRKLSDYLLTFEAPSVPEPLDPFEVEIQARKAAEERTRRSKAAWLGWAGLDMEGKPVRPLKVQAPPRKKEG